MYVNELTAAEHATRSAGHGAQGERPLMLLLGRMRFQLLVGAFVAVLLPALARGLYEPGTSLELSFDQSLVGTFWAFLLGYLLFRKVTGFPGVRATAFILPVFIASYGIAITGFFLLRLDYSRLQFLISFLVSVAFFYGVFIIVRRLHKMQLAIVPGGDTKRLTTLSFVNWRVLASPTEAAGAGGIVADLRSSLPEEWERFIAERAIGGAPVYDARHVFESLTGRVQIEHLSENPIGTLTPNSIYASGKRYLDFLTAVAALAVAWPMLLLCAIVIRLESRGPAIFKQERMGFRGRPFTIYKLRTMRQEPANGESIEGQMTRTDDNRITRFGRFLRKTRLDELPQVINILRGEMSWIGPRPEAIKLSGWYESAIPFYRYRHIVRPGLTGWAQVNQGHVTSLDDADLKLQYDFFYVKNFSLWLDILVLLRTIRVVLTGHGAR
jgi:lipopolysaccharide/colanic/teichoic acid biosynthesis glycosyltransferase